MTIVRVRTPEEGYDLITSYRALLCQAGYQPARVDTYASPDDSIKIRIGYAGGEWRITTTAPAHASKPWTVKVNWRYELPSIEQMMAATVEGFPRGFAFDANREAILRGVEQ